MNVAAKTAPAPSAVLRLHHFAYRCRDAEETRQFYEDVLGLPLVHVVKEFDGAEHRRENAVRASVLRIEGRIVHRLFRSRRQREARAVAEYAGLGQSPCAQSPFGEGR